MRLWDAKNPEKRHTFAFVVSCRRRPMGPSFSTDGPSMFGVVQFFIAFLGCSFGVFFYPIDAMKADFVPSQLGTDNWSARWVFEGQRVDVG